MRISTVTHYASRLLLELALHADQAPVSAATLAERTGIPFGCVEDVMDTLHAAGLVSLAQDAGFFLGQPPRDVSLGQVVRLMDGGIRLSHCRSSEEQCPLCHKCKTKDVWAGVIEAIERELDSITLADLMAPPLPAMVPPADAGCGGSVR